MIYKGTMYVLPYSPQSSHRELKEISLVEGVDMKEGHFSWDVNSLGRREGHATPNCTYE